MKSGTPSSPEQTVADLRHLAWCALVALRLMQLEGQALSPLTAHTFLLRWFAGAQKQRRFPRSVSGDIDALLQLGRQKGLDARLVSRLEELWRSCSPPVSRQSDLFRLSSAIETLKAEGWLNAVVTDEEWDTPSLTADYAGTSALLVKKTALIHHFTESGQMSNPVTFAVVGEHNPVSMALGAQGFLCTVANAEFPGSVLLTLIPE